MGVTPPFFLREWSVFVRFAVFFFLGRCIRLEGGGGGGGEDRVVAMDSSCGCVYFGLRSCAYVRAVFGALLRLPLFRKLYRRSFAGVLRGMGLRFAGRGTKRIVMGDNAPYGRLVFLLGKRLSLRAASGSSLFAFVRRLRTPCIVRPCTLFNVGMGCTSSCVTRARSRAVDVDGTFILSNLLGCRVFHLGCVGFVDGQTRGLCNHL